LVHERAVMHTGYRYIDGNGPNNSEVVAMITVNGEPRPHKKGSASASGANKKPTKSGEMSSEFAANAAGPPPLRYPLNE
jgi:hypothetical protein